MSAKAGLTREVRESIRHVLGKNIRVNFCCAVRLETKAEKMENRVLVFSSCRLFIFTSKVPAKIEHTYHYLEILGLESKKPNQLCLSVENRILSVHSVGGDSEDVDRMISQLGTAIKTIFPQVPLEHVIRKFEVEPVSRMEAMLEYNMDLETNNKDLGPCGGYSAQYACMCDYHALPYKEEVAWDVDTIYLSHDSKELSLMDFDHLDGRDLVPIISALSFNAWFTKFRASNSKLVAEALDQLLQVMRKTVAIEELYLDNIGVKWDFAHKLAMALISNPNTPFHTLDLSNNLIEDKGVSSLCGIIAKITQGAGHLSATVGKLQRGLIHLNLSRTGLTSKGINTLAHALSLNRSMPSTLTYLNLSENPFKEDINNLYNFLAQPNSLTHLDLSGTDCALDTVFGALLRGCTQKLSHLTLCRSVFSTKKAKDMIVPPSFKAFFTSTVALKKLNLSGCRQLPVEALKAMLLGLACNEIATDVELDLSSSDLRSQGALVLESCLPGIRCLCSLDISDNAFDVDLANIIQAVGKNKSLKHLFIGRNFTTIKPKHLGKVLDAVVQLIQEEDSALETLSLADSKLRTETCMVLNALGSNQSLTSLDLQGNFMGAPGAKTLAKALQINTRLRSLWVDRNNIPVQGFQDLAYAMEKNFTLRYMPCPTNDVAIAMKVSPEKTEAAIKKIEELLCRNVTPQINVGQAFRLQQGFIFSSTQHMVDRLMVHVQDTVNMVKRSSKEDDLTSTQHIESAELYLRDANNSKQLLTRLHEVVLQQEVSGNPLELQLQDFVDTMNNTIANYLRVTSSCMVECLQRHCPTIMSDEKVKQDVEEICEQRAVVSTEIVRHALVDQAGADIINRVSEVNLSIAAHVSDRILDEVTDSLHRCHRELAECMNHQRSTTPDVLRGRSRADTVGLRNSRSRDSQLDSYSESSDSPLATPKLAHKRRSVHTRKLRPTSVVDSIEGLGPDDVPDLLPKESDDSLPSLSPTSDKLEHLGKDRPRRPKTRAPTRPCLPVHATSGPNGEALLIGQDEQLLQNLGEGLEVFFRRNPHNNTPSLSPDSEEIRGRANSNSTTTSETLSIGSRQDRSPDKDSSNTVTINNANNEKRGLIRGFANLFSRSAAKDEQQMQKSRSCDAMENQRPIIAQPSPAHQQPHSSVPTPVIDEDIPPAVPPHRSRSLTPKDEPPPIMPHATDKSSLPPASSEKSLSPGLHNGQPAVAKLEEERIVPACSPKLEKLGVGVAPNSVLAEMRARQEKRSAPGGNATSISSCKQEDRLSSSSLSSELTSSTQSLLQAVRLKPTGLADQLKSPTEYNKQNQSQHSQEMHSLEEISSSSCGSGIGLAADRNSPLRASTGRVMSSPISMGGSPSGSPRLGGITSGSSLALSEKPSLLNRGPGNKPPPLVPPKPRPKSVVGGETRLSGDFSSNLEDGEDLGKSPERNESTMAPVRESLTSRLRSVYMNKTSESTVLANGAKSSFTSYVESNTTSSSGTSTNVTHRWSRTPHELPKETPPPQQDKDHADVVDV